MEKNESIKITTSEQTNDNWRLLAIAIISQAIKDYERLVRKKELNKNEQKEMDELKYFFASEWCNALLNLSTSTDYYYTNGDVINFLDKMIERRQKDNAGPLKNIINL